MSSKAPVDARVSDLIELGRPATSGLLAAAPVAAAVGAIGPAAAAHAAGIAIGALLTMFAGMGSNALNDYFDWQADRVNHPERPIPSGRVPMKAALRFALVAYAVGAGLIGALGLMNYVAAAGLALTALAIQVAYEAYFKQHKWAGNVVIGVQTMLAFVFGGLVVGRVALPAILGTTALFMIASREIVKDMGDLPGDRGKPSLPRIIGSRRALTVAGILAVGGFIAAVIPFFPMGVYGPGYIVPVVAAFLVVVGALSLAARNPRRGRRVMKLAMAIAILGFVVGGLLYVR